ncbi:MAG: ABC transporter ATP-binding protein [Gemmatimonadetes bacterium]|nr:ABC transporter ATP-binding protein [Gemmatimonadota bacterium]MBT5058171.1 ABC transporter ATP-binding protein [Gemmatimonadota bacterium]MBT5142619.1 ABC transporter ATP-binding protein [Gemmatimonadota bacterium]MBT5592212.1 ABC transporter ATP-binding protein [Gemmatimonadota bacterium]MBT7455781.1 ABC transporter ATP-binding protein [Gemmatimonadota bacterium]
MSDQPESGRLLEAAPPQVTRALETLLASGEHELIRVDTDLTDELRYGRRWVIVTERRAIVMSVIGDVVAEASIDELAFTRADALVGGGELTIERKSAPTIRVTYSSTEAVKFSEVARGLEQLRKGEDFLIRATLDRIRCDRCGRLLPEKNSLCPACVRRFATLGRIVSYMAPHRWRAVTLAVASVAMTLAELAPPLVTRRLIDDVMAPVAEPIPPVDERLVLLGSLVMMLAGVRLFSWTAELVHGWTNTWLSARITADIRAQLYRRLEMLSLQFYDKRSTGSLISRVSRDSGTLQEFLIDGLPYVIINALMMVGILGLMLHISWKVTLLILIPVPLMGVWSWLFWKRMRRLFHKYQQGWSKLSTRLNESLNGIRVVKAFAQEQREIETFDRANEDLADVSVRTAMNWNVLWATMSVISGSGMLIIWYFGGREVLGDELTLGDLLALYSYMWMVYGPLEWFSEVNTWMTRAFAGAERIFEVIDTPPEAYDDPKARKIPRIEGAVRFSGVTFGYDKSKPVLHDINLDVQPGEMIGLVGKSGVGKTTTVNLVCRFYDVDHGGIEIDGVDIRDIRLEDLRRQIGIVPQDPVLFSGSIADNICYGRPDASLSQIMDAARAANAHQFILAKGDGYDTRIGERGVGLSGGERQRIAIARAILHNPRVLILDEATSSVDVETEKQIQESLGRLVKGRTTFAIAHRLSTLRNADRLVVLSNGRVMEVGSHEELLEVDGHFAELVRLQQEVAQIIGVSE